MQEVRFYIPLQNVHYIDKLSTSYEHKANIKHDVIKRPRPMCPRTKSLGRRVPLSNPPLDVPSLTYVSRPWTASKYLS